MNLKNLLIPILALLAFSSYAQTNAVRANSLGSSGSDWKPGIRISAYYGVESSKLHDRRFESPSGQAGNTTVEWWTLTQYFSPTMGLQAEYLFSKHLSVTADIERTRETYDVEWLANQNYFPDSTMDISSYGMVNMNFTSMRIPIMARLRFGRRVEGSLLAGGYLTFILKNEVRGFFDNSALPTPESLNSIPLLGDGLAPNTVRFGVGGGFEVRYDLPFKGGISFRLRFGRDLTSLYNYPKFGTTWSTAQLGYGIDL